MKALLQIRQARGVILRRGDGLAVRFVQGVPCPCDDTVPTIFADEPAARAMARECGLLDCEVEPAPEISKKET